MSFLENALKLANNGFHVFPLKPGTKVPAINDFPNKATKDPEVIKAWWTDPMLEIEKDFNIGISTSRFGSLDDFEGALLVVDVDNKGDKKGNDELWNLELEGKDFPVTFTQTTPTGGKHLVYYVGDAVKQGVNVLANGLDIRSKGGYIVGAGSVLENGEYGIEKEMKLLKIAPTWLTQACGLAPEKKEAPSAPINVNQDAARERAIWYLENEAPESIKGQGGDQTAYRVAARVKDLGIDVGNCLELMMDHWFNGSGWHPEKLLKKIEHAYRYGIDPVGAASPEAQFEKVLEPEMLSYLEQMNKEYAIVYMEGNHNILHETIDEKGRPKLDLMNEPTFKRRFSPFTLEKKATYATEWLDWKGRREYKGLCFAPEREARNGYYNLWRGFTVTPLAYKDGNDRQRGGFDAFMEHTRQNICKGDEGLFTWLLGYFAHMVQRPFERPLTTLVFRGGKGTGKNAFVDRIGAILGAGHYLVAHDGRYLTSNFNAHFDSCLCLVLDEAFWSGDKSAEGKLKGLTTAPEIMIERKGKEPYTVDNLVRLIIIGNEEWLVPASSDERRYTVCDVGDGRKQDTEFFHDMRVMMDIEGGNRVLLDFLKNFDLSNVNVNKAYQTEALLDQKLESLDPFQQWWHQCLTEGTLGDYGWPEFIDKEYFRSSYARYCMSRQIRSRVPNERSMSVNFFRICKSAKSQQLRKEGDRKMHYHLPSLEVCRQEWDEFIGQPTEWEQE